MQCWAIIDTQAKRHLNGVSLEGDDGPLQAVFGSSHLDPLSPPQKGVRVGTPLAKLSGS